MIDMAEPDINAFCAHLKAEREERGISLEAISGRTRINMRFLEAIERAEFDVLQDVYVRIFVRNYVRCIGLDETALMKEFDQLRGTGEPEPPVGPEPEEAGTASGDAPDADDASGAGPARLGPDTVKKFLPFAFGAVLIMALGYFLVGRVDDASRETAAKVPVPAARPETRVPAAVPAPPPVPSPGLAVKLDALRYVWVLVAADGRDTLHSGFLQAGSTAHFEADSVLFIKIGLNESGSNAIGLSLNGRNLGEWGAPRTRLTKFGVTADGIDAARVVSRAIRTPSPDPSAAAPAADAPHAAPSDTAGGD